jgi:lysophospholipase L1-like esterase
VTSRSPAEARTTATGSLGTGTAAAEPELGRRVRSFYQGCSFPDYDPDDSPSSLMAKAARSGFAAWLSEQMSFGESVRVLDVGCGTGQLPIFLSLHNRTVVGAAVRHDRAQAIPLRTEESTVEDRVDEDRSGQPSPPSRRVQVAQNLALAVVSFLLVFVVAELALKGAGYGKVELYRADPLLYWSLEPNQKRFTKVDRHPVHTNSHGTRGPEFQVRKPANVFRVLAVGDSKTFGWGLPDEETYARVIERELQHRVRPGVRVEVINAGVNAWSYDQILAYLRERGLSYEPDLVVLGDANLWTEFSPDASPEFVRAFMRRVHLKNLLRRSAIYHYGIELKLQRFYDRHRVRFIPVDPTREAAPMDSDAAVDHWSAVLDDIARLLHEQETAAIFLYMPTEGEVAGTSSFANGEIRRVKAATADRYGFPFLDLTNGFREYESPLFLPGDVAHPNARGNRLIAERLVDVVGDLGEAGGI